MAKKIREKITDLNLLRQDLSFEVDLLGEKMKFNTTLGLFSPREIDEGTLLFLENIQVKETDSILDLGCGYGAIGVTLAKKASKGHVQMVDKDFVAVEYANKNIHLNEVQNAQAYLSNGFRDIIEKPQFDVIVSNLPAHIGNDFLYLMLNDAKARLKPGGTFQVVTISRLRPWIKRHMQEVFGNYEKVKQGRMHTVSIAVKE
jgi:16S rRNA (guanine1207-N2)-methyltransferase